MSVDPVDHFPPAYAPARERFLRAAERRGGTLWSYPIGARGPHGEELSVDVAQVGPRDPESMLVVSSGLHGVEGFAGSAIQHQLLSAQLESLDLPPDTGVLLVHALNPYGFAWVRRVNESNVDLNRNFSAIPTSTCRARTTIGYTAPSIPRRSTTARSRRRGRLSAPSSPSTACAAYRKS